MTVRQEALLLALAAPLLAVAGVRSGLLPHTLSVPAWYLLLAAPVWEELLFRRVLQQRLLQQRWNNRRLLRLTPATWLTAAFFVLAHLPFQGANSLPLLLPALALGRLFERTGQVLPCILLHSWFNLCWLLAAITATM